MKRLRKYLLLTSGERAILARAVILLWTTRIGLWVLPFRILRPFITRATHAPVDLQASQSSSVERIAWIVAVASRYVPKATCLTQALAAQALLGWYGIPSQVCIGVARGEGGELKAHAWLESRGTVVVGGSEDKYTPLPQVHKAKSRLS